ncbi:MAG: efflux RND transporter periplasmic adaptor subunit [Selenomonadaceae bacterium]|nr:efflux RND transporter periplasmic adaptor subunit [Selenomonadaceae bacterium]MBR4383632.1 efflux RND transporter periplasmic adaptor subunit [Selenomonadaceae bacterium]
MKKLYFVGLALILAAAVAIIAYGAYLNESGEKQITERMESRTIPLHGEKINFRNIRPVFVLNTINLSSDEMADAVALIDGRIEKTFVKKNSDVRRGEVLFELINEDIPIKIQQADSSIAKAQAQVLRARNSFNRYERLRDRNATSLEKYDEARMNYEAAEASLREAQAVKDQLLVQDSRQEVIAPIDGEVLILYKQIGAYVQAGTPIALVGNFERLNFSLPVEDSRARQISIGEHFELNFRNSSSFRKAYDTEYGAGNLGNSQIFSVFVREIMPDLSQAAEMRKIVFEIDNRVGILEQQAYSNVELTRTTPHRVLAVPLAALSDNRQYVFVETPDNKLQRRKISVGADDGKYAEVLSGLSEGEIVITSATKGLTEDTKVTVTLTEDKN